MVVLFFFVLFAFFLLFPAFRCAFFHLFLFFFYLFRDFFRFFAHREFNRYGVGELVAYVGLFGKGKTLSAVHRVITAYKAFDGKKVWCFRRRKIVTQRIKIISNVALSDVPYERLVSLKQVVQAATGQEAIDNEHDTLTMILVLGDEFSAQMNSRNFRSNIDPVFLRTLLTCRHYNVSIYYTAQRFNQVDALLRQVTSYVIDCEKVWRFMRLAKYSAWDLENASSPQMVAPYARSCWFVRDKDYAAYDTFAVVDNLERDVASGVMFTPEQILALQCNQSPSMEAVGRPSARWFRRFRKGR